MLHDEDMNRFIKGDTSVLENIKGKDSKAN